MSSDKEKYKPLIELCRKNLENEVDDYENKTPIIKNVTTGYYGVSAEMISQRVANIIDKYFDEDLIELAIKKFYLTDEVFNKKDKISESALRIWFKFTYNEINDQTTRLLNVFALYCGYMGWKGYGEGLKIEDWMEKQKRSDLASKEKSSQVNIATIIEESIYEKITVQQLNKELANIKSEIFTNQNHVIKVCDGLLKVDTLSESFVFLIREYFKPHHSYYSRAILSAGLAISVLRKWDEKKVSLLTEIVTMRKETYCYERALLGIIFALIVSFRTSNFRKTLRLINILNIGSDFALFLIGGSKFIFKNTALYQSKDLSPQSLGVLKFNIFCPNPNPNPSSFLSYPFYARRDMDFSTLIVVIDHFLRQPISIKYRNRLKMDRIEQMAFLKEISGKYSIDPNQEFQIKDEMIASYKKYLFHGYKW